MSRIKSTKRFKLSTEALNSKGFRVRTEGINLSQFKENPILYWMHKRPEGNVDDTLPLGGWVDLQVDAEARVITAVPEFDEDDFSKRIYDKVESGTIKMASAGLQPVEWRDVDGELWLWESILVEGTVCDRGSNPEALAVQLYNEKDELINLTEDYLNQVTNETFSDMKLINLNAEDAKVIGLSEGEHAPEVLITKAKLLAGQVVSLTDEKDAAELAKTKAETDLQELKTSQDREKLVALVDKAVEDKKITADEKVQFLGDPENNIEALSYEKAEAMLKLRAPHKSAEEHLNDKEKSGSELDALMKLSYDELDKSGDLGKLKKLDLAAFNQKGKEKYGEKWEVVKA